MFKKIIIVIIFNFLATLNTYAVEAETYTIDVFLFETNPTKEGEAVNPLTIKQPSISYDILGESNYEIKDNYILQPLAEEITQAQEKPPIKLVNIDQGVFMDKARLISGTNPALHLTWEQEILAKNYPVKIELIKNQEQIKSAIFKDRYVLIYMEIYRDKFKYMELQAVHKYTKQQQAQRRESINAMKYENKSYQENVERQNVKVVKRRVYNKKTYYIDAKDLGILVNITKKDNSSKQ